MGRIIVGFYQRAGRLIVHTGSFEIGFDNFRVAVFPLAVDSSNSVHGCQVERCFRFTWGNCLRKKIY